jgi:UDP-N-acetylglucosamine:LPS N-acetylglucosamine transferase
MPSSKTRRKKIFIMITDAGGGHRGTANSLKAAIEKARLPWDVRIINVYKEVWQSIEFGQRFLHIAGEDVYNFVLEHSLTSWAPTLRKTARLIVKLQHRPAEALTRGFFEAERPDLVLSIMPFVNDVYAEALRGSGIPLGLLLSDLVDTKPYMWLTPKASQAAAFVGVGGEGAAAQAREMGVPPSRLVQGGLVIHPKHFEPAAQRLSQAAARRAFGLEPGLFTPMILMGGYGGPAIREFVEAFEASPSRWQVVACCGRNLALKAQIEAMAPRLKNRVLALGFSTELHRLMRAADVMVAKPGPASIFEGLAMGIPLVLDDAATMPQEAPNARFVEAQGFGLSVRRRSHMLAAVASLASQPAQMATMRKAIKAYRVADASQPVIAAIQAAMGPR